MKSTHVILRLAATLAALTALSPAWAIKVEGESPPSATTSRPAFAGQPSGKIDRIDLTANAMVVDGVTYVFSGATIVVHAPDSAQAISALKLRPGDRIRFTTRREANSPRERITEIWVLDDKAPAGK